MMAYAMFRCCVTAKHLPEFDLSTDDLLSRLGIATMDVPEFGCCGYPLKNVDLVASLAASARNLALAERAGRPILTSCACCFGTLQHAARLLEDQALLTTVNASLASEGLCYGGTAVIKHLFHVLKEDVGLDRIAGAAGASHAFQKVAIQYGCKLLRPNLAARLASPEGEAPFFERLVATVGSTVVPWGLEKDCCGSGISTTDLTLANTISQAKMFAAQNAGAEGVAVACPFCMLQLRKVIPETDGVTVLSVAQLLCLALGMEGRVAA